MASPRRSAELRPLGRDRAALIKRIANGDASALAALYDTTCGLIYGLLLRILGSSERAEQVLVAVYQEVWEQAAAYDDEHEKPMTWLITRAHSRAVAQLRADGYNQPCQASLELASRTLRTKSKTDEITSGGQKLVQSALAELSPAQQQIIELAYFSGLRQNEIAAFLSLSLQSVQMGMRAAMRKLREVLESHQLHLA
ncbi:MAG: sigma-70 family RNA polymerase sigma factor [Acidobacteria bacterium]|nr:sigma-70 family RNA polymerase sigma factor [Acidobacteriota bacterium]